jgi:hypothetical protein
MGALMANRTLVAVSDGSGKPPRADSKQPGGKFEAAMPAFKFDAKPSTGRRQSQQILDRLKQLGKLERFGEKAIAIADQSLFRTNQDAMRFAKANGGFIGGFVVEINHDDLRDRLFLNVLTGVHASFPLDLCATRFQHRFQHGFSV